MMQVGTVLAGLAALVWLGAVPARAEDSPAGIGRISYEASPVPGAAICTGVLVAPDLVLTAAHCVRSAVESPETLRFDAGWSGGDPSGRRLGAAVILADDSDSAGLAALQEDMALVVLDRAFPSDAFPPISLTDPESGPFTLIAFDRSAPNQPRSAVLCRPLAKPPGLVALDCPVVSGNSGAPILQRDGEGWRVVAVMVATSRGGPVRSWAAVPTAAFRQQIMARGAGSLPD
jgi:hypothetical protein